MGRSTKIAGDRPDQSEESIRTFSGRRINPTDIKPEDITKEDIARGLAHQPRWAGQTSQHYSVGAHSIAVAKFLRENGADTRLQLAGLLHDAAEAYMADLPRPIKVLCNGYRDIELDFVKAIFAKFNIPFELYGQVKSADIEVTEQERGWVFDKAEYLFYPKTVERQFLLIWNLLEKELKNGKSKKNLETPKRTIKRKSRV